MKSDLVIAQEAELKPIVEIAEQIGLSREDLDLYGDHKAKISLEALERYGDHPDGKLIDITAITPTPLGEGKTVTLIGVSMALAQLGEKVITTIREPSMGPVFGIKGGAAGGGYSQVLPMEDINLHFTGDIHAVGAATNLLASMLDNQMFHPRYRRKNKLDIDPETISWNRVVDINDAALTTIEIGTESRHEVEGYPRKTGYDITVASEVMAILSMATSIQDLRERLGRIVVAYSKDGKPVTAEDLNAAGAMTVVLKEALKPNLIQTVEHTPAIMHCGPFANIAHGNNSVMADKIALKLADYVVTESGFGADCGAEKFMDIKCRVGGYEPDCVVLVATIRALKMHGGGFDFPPGKTPPKEVLERENVEAVKNGCANMEKHIENLKKFGVPVVVAINRFAADTEAEIEAVQAAAVNAGAEAAVPGNYHAEGGAGALEIAKAVRDACEKPSEFSFLYPDEMPIADKIRTIATEIYGADDVEFSETAQKKIEQFTALGYDKLPICMAKTHLSISHDPKLKGRPTGFTLPVRDIRPSIGAGYLYPLCGKMRTMPGLPSVPAAERVDIDENGDTVGLF